MIKFGTKVAFELEEGLLVTFMRFATVDNYEKMTGIFGRSETTLNSIFNATVIFLDNKLMSLIDPSLPSPDNCDTSFERWAPKVKEFAAAIEAHTDVCTTFGNAKAIGFIDGSTFSISTPSLSISREAHLLYYSGYKKTCLMNFQVCIFPNGLMCNVSRSFPGVTNDRGMRIETEIDNAARSLSEAADAGFDAVFYGDQAYSPSREHLFKGHTANENTVQELEETVKLNLCRLSVEHIFGLNNIWKHVTKKEKLKLFESSCGLEFIFRVSFLLTNWYTCLKGNQIQGKYGVSPQDIETYMMGGIE
jgi:hypothetical protein